MAECFTINSREIEGRIDSFYYSPEFIRIVNRLRKSKFNCVNFEDLIEDISGGATPRVEGDFYSDSGIPFLRVQNITENGIDLEDVKFIKKEVHEKMLKRSQLHENELIFTITGRIGSVAVVPKEFEGNINQHSVRIKLKKKINNIHVLPEYVALFLNLETGRKLSLRKTTGGTRPALDYTAIRELMLPLPNLETQNEFLEKIREAYLAKKQKEAEAQKLLDSINDYVLDELGIKLPELKDRMAYAVDSGELQNNRINAYYYQPKFLEIEQSLKSGKYKFASLKKFLTKIHYGVSINNEYVDKGVPLLRIVNLKPNALDLSEVVNLDESKRREIGNGFVYAGDLLISRSGSVGIVAVVSKEADGFAFGSFMIKFCLNNDINKEYVSVWFNSGISKMLIGREKIGAIQGNITIDTIENLMIPLAPRSIQDRIAEEVKKRMHQAEQLRKEATENIEKVKEEVEKIILEK